MTHDGTERHVEEAGGSLEERERGRGQHGILLSLIAEDVGMRELDDARAAV